jgi:hypothetical protein
MKISIVTFGCLLALFCIIDLSNGIDWNNNWAFACDFYEQNLRNIQIRGEDCGPECDRDPQCSHFAWTTYNGGTCWLKTGGATKNDAFPTNDNTMVCGLSAS